jgi:hypothetical protein
MTQNTRIYDRFYYHAEDLNCSYCLLKKRKTKFNPHGCGEDACRFEGIRLEAIANGRIKRKPRWFKPCRA